MTIERSRLNQWLTAEHEFNEQGVLTHERRIDNNGLVVGELDVETGEYYDLSFFSFGDFSDPESRGYKLSWYDRDDNLVCAFECNPDGKTHHYSNGKWS